MTGQASINKAGGPSFQEGVSILRLFRLLSNEEQRIAYAILEGMRLQKDLDSQSRDQPSA